MTCLAEKNTPNENKDCITYSLFKRAQLYYHSDRNPGCLKLAQEKLNNLNSICEPYKKKWEEDTDEKLFRSDPYEWRRLFEIERAKFRRDRDDRRASGIFDQRSTPPTPRNRKMIPPQSSHAPPPPTPSPPRASPPRAPPQQTAAAAEAARKRAAAAEKEKEEAKKRAAAAEKEKEEAKKRAAAAEKEKEIARKRAAAAEREEAVRKQREEEINNAEIERQKEEAERMRQREEAERMRQREEAERMRQRSIVNDEQIATFLRIIETIKTLYIKLNQDIHVRVKEWELSFNPERKYVSAGLYIEKLREDPIQYHLLVHELLSILSIDDIKKIDEMFQYNNIPIPFSLDDKNNLDKKIEEIKKTIQNFRKTITVNMLENIINQAKNVFIAEYSFIIEYINKTHNTGSYGGNKSKHNKKKLNISKKNRKSNIRS